MHCAISGKKLVTYNKGFPQKKVENGRGNCQK